MRKSGKETASVATYTPEIEVNAFLYSESRVFPFVSESFSSSHVLIQNKIPKGARKK